MIRHKTTDREERASPGFEKDELCIVLRINRNYPQGCNTT